MRRASHWKYAGIVGIRESTYRYASDAVREAILNALVHRDWTRSMEVEVVNYSDRLEVTSPGALKNSMTIEKMLAGIVHELGFDDLHFHDLRHEAVSRLVEAGMSDQEVAAISGHKSMQMLKR